MIFIKVCRILVEFLLLGEPKYIIYRVIEYDILSGMIHTRVEVHRIDSEMSKLVE